ncbi:MAG: MFS transporter [Spirochaetales bacterium]|nr:MFS transporter [Spirochaetales bacterium]
MFNKNFIMVVIGQIISLFGNAILRFALPLYLLNKTGSPALFGMVSAIAFIPLIMLAPVGGMLADRRNKKKIMVVLDSITAGVTLLTAFCIGRFDIVIIILSTLILLYGIQGAYQPAVQASIPALLSEENLTSGNAVINLTNSLSQLAGPVLGGILFVSLGIYPLLYISAGCFILSAIMETFIKIPFIKRAKTQNILKTAAQDMKESFIFTFKTQPEVGKVSVVIAGFNLFLSTLIIIGLPIVITQKMGFSSDTGNRYYGFAEGAMAAGSLAGGIIAGIFGNRLKMKKSPAVLFAASLTMVPIGLVLISKMPKHTGYMIILLSCFALMLLCTIFTVVGMAFIQRVSPQELIGKIIALVSCICMIVQPIGQAIYGLLFEYIPFNSGYLFIASSILSIIICILYGKFVKIED